jgi:hypothetical protein
MNSTHSILLCLVLIPPPPHPPFSLSYRRLVRYAIDANGDTNWHTIFGAIVMAAGSALVLMMAFMYASIKKVEKEKNA